MWGFTPQLFSQLEKLFSEFLSENIDNLSSEFYIPFAVDNLIQSNIATVEVLETTEQWFGVTYKDDSNIVKNKIKSLVENNTYPSNLWVNSF